MDESTQTRKCQAICTDTKYICICLVMSSSLQELGKPHNTKDSYSLSHMSQEKCMHTRLIENISSYN